MKRLTQLDSLRGIAALIVLFSHMASTLPFFGDSDSSEVNNRFLNIILQSPLRIILSGHESVIFFFVLSGFVLSLPYFESSNNENYFGYILKRYFRIAIPYYMSLIVTLICIVLFSNRFVEGFSDWFHSLWSTPINLGLIMKHFLLIGFFNTDSYNFVVWSLVHEMRVSLIFPFLIIAVIKFRESKIIFINILVSIFGYTLWKHYGLQDKSSIFATIYYIPMFVVGCLLSKTYKKIIVRFDSFSKTKTILLFVLAILLYSFPETAKSFKVIHKYLIDEWFTVFGTILFILLGLGSNKFKSFLTKKPLNFLGKISYSIYLYHSIVLFSLIYIFGNRIPLIVIFLFVIIITVFISTIAYNLVEKPSAKVGKMLAKLFENKLLRNSMKRDYKKNDPKENIDRMI